ncbi:MAG: Hsp20/alpha crystallin family protein [Candidatus Rokubacteria bacterium]|nr:Hsp20/alpha crystallin family protein [Candidatus Rokubacteria bacterium]
MTTRTNADNWHEMRRLQREMERLFGDFTPAWRWPLTGEYPPINVYRDEQAITLEALCPGVGRDDLDVSVVGDAVTIRGERKPPPDAPEERYQRRERPLGAFTRTCGVGERLDPDRTQATYSHGILRVRLARAPEATPKKIAIQG